VVGVLQSTMLRRVSICKSSPWMLSARSSDHGLADAHFASACPKLYNPSWTARRRIYFASIVRSIMSRQSARQRSRSPLSRPTTPLRPSSRSSFRNSQTNGLPFATALDALEPQFAELSDSMADLEANFMHLQLMHESLSRFGESFASFLYGLNMNAFVVDFPEVRLNFLNRYMGSY